MAKTSVFFRLHEWLADHVKGVQYPRQQYIPARPIFVERPKLGFLEALAVFQLGVVGLLISLVLLAVGLLFSYFLLVAVFIT